MTDTFSFDYGFLGTRTTDKVLRVLDKLQIKGYVKHFHRNTNGDYNHLLNFFIWKKEDKKSEYIRLTLMSDVKGFYWNLEKSFKPFAYKHNHREGANIKSEYFNKNDDDKYYNYFLNMIDMIKGLQ